MKFIFQSLILSCAFTFVLSSIGDNSPFYNTCVERCVHSNCSKDGNFAQDGLSYDRVLRKLLAWNCVDDCKYECMWKTVAAFERRHWGIPQFHGKWPFIRIFGIQEPASAVFSILNLYVHYTSFKLFRTKVDKSSPLYWLWSSFFMVCMNAWIWSTIFHSRDLLLTEFMDYICAFSMVLMTFFCMLMRVCINSQNLLKWIITSFIGSFFMNHIYYLSHGQFDYGYNMKLNIFVGVTNAIGWFIWCYSKRKRQPYVWKCAAFFLLVGASMVLELFDFSPILWTFDSHSLWHLSTAMITPLFYSFITDDCQYLQQQMKSKKYP